MSTLDTNSFTMATSIERRKRMQRSYKVYFFISVFCLVFGQIYLHYSYGMDSFYMRNLFLLPLVFGTIPMLLLSFVGYQSISRISFNLWNSGIAVLTFGFLVQGVIELSGRSTHYTLYYWYVGAFFCLASLTALLVGLLSGRKEA